MASQRIYKLVDSVHHINLLLEEGFSVINVQNIEHEKKYLVEYLSPISKENDIIIPNLDLSKKTEIKNYIAQINLKAGHKMIYEKLVTLEKNTYKFTSIQPFDSDKPVIIKQIQLEDVIKFVETKEEELNNLLNSLNKLLSD